MNIPNAFVVAILVGGFVAAQPANAATIDRTYQDQGGPACQLSMPTTSSQVRPRATGMRNEGTASEFVICQFPSNGTPFFRASITIVRIDENNHDVQCTAVNGTQLSGIQYSTRTATTGTDGTPNSITWDRAWGDFPSPYQNGPTDRFSQPALSVTCILPPGAAIQGVYGSYHDDVGQ
ncbi:hypothetical protein FNZ56_08785 [Pseudoluteimonas lycopersici]|uniref:Spore coat protein U domain-containing protein n=1 Tax=Pseudoluteimonas lycopersici TaxID=1324796 RepID=A0A516V612_9GAMM|nr:hypothetical protein [Lysobacter lycopersici]QDQ73964.1 hypothetical protein FNZ56_08785 [Lysobacter lycopersici]